MAGGIGGFPSRPNFPLGGPKIASEGLRAQLAVLKAADTARISTATLTADPDLVLPLAANARYLVEAELLIQLGAGVSGGFQCSWSYSGTWVTGYGRSTNWDASSVTGGINSRWRGSAFPSFVGGFANATYNAATELVNHHQLLVINTTTAGNLSLTWAQVAATALNTTLNANSILRATRIS